jgi:hypothetical protein
VMMRCLPIAAQRQPKLSRRDPKLLPAIAGMKIQGVE